MNKHLIIITVVALAAFTACSSEDSRPAGDMARGQLEIRMGSSVGELTRSNNASNLLNGDTVYVWTEMINGATQEVGEYFNAWALKANGVGGLSTLVAGNTKLFPATNVLNFYALCGNFGVETEGERTDEPMIEAEVTPLPTTGIRHTVLSDQRSPEAYYKSDLLYAMVKNQEPISEAVVLPFRHLLSRVQVVLVAGSGVSTTELSTATVKILNLKRQVAFNANPDETETTREAYASMLSQSNLFQTGDILMATNTVATASDATAPGSTVYADAIVVPQTIAKGEKFIQVDYLDHTTYYRIPNGSGDSDFELESGKQYRFRLIASRIGDTYLMNVSIDNWDVQSGTAVWAE